MARKIIERKTYGCWTLVGPESKVFRESKVFNINQHVKVVYRGKTREGWIHRLHPVNLEVQLYDGPMIRVDPFMTEGV